MDKPEMITEDLLSMIMRHEGFEPYPYKCTAGKWTIGYGRNLEGKPLSKKIAELMLKEDIGDSIKDLFGVFPGFYKYSENRRMALIDFMLNVGNPTFKKFKKMIAAIKNNDWKTAANEFKDSDYYSQVGIRAPELERMIREG